MATHSESHQLRKLQAENKRLRLENKQLHKQISTGKSAAQPRQNIFRKIGVVLCVSLAAALLLVGNVLFWTGNTLVKSDQYVAATSPIIKNPHVQDALATNISKQLFNNVDIDQVVQQALPPKADFLAPTIADQVRQHTDTTVKKILQRPQFQQRWNDAQLRAHDRFIKLVDEHGSDGSININEVYSDASQQLKSTKLAFLADKPLPDSVGQIQLVSGNWLSVLQKTIQNIDTWRVLALILLAVFSVLGVWLSRNRRKTVIVLGSMFALAAFVTLVGIRVGSEVVAHKVNSQYTAATKEVYGIVSRSLVVQTRTIFCAALLMIFIAWVSGGSAAAQTFRRKIDQLFSGKLHEAIFAKGENSFTRWIGAHKAILQWLIVIVVAASLLFVRLTPMTLLVQVLCILILVLIVEILAAKPPA